MLAVQPLGTCPCRGAWRFLLFNSLGDHCVQPALAGLEVFDLLLNTPPGPFVALTLGQAWTVGGVQMFAVQSIGACPCRRAEHGSNEENHSRSLEHVDLHQKKISAASSRAYRADTSSPSAQSTSGAARSLAPRAKCFRRSA